MRGMGGGMERQRRRKAKSIGPGVDADDDPELSWRTVRTLVPYLWPKDAPGMRLRVVAAVILLVLNRALNVVTPVFLAQAVDRITEPGGLAADVDPVIVVPVALLIGYGVMRLMVTVTNELRDLAFVRVAQAAIRDVGLNVFRHLHSLSLRFHLDRQTGGLSRALDRGTMAIEFLLRIVVFRVLPTVLEFLMIAAVLWWMLDWRFSAVLITVLIAYVVFTFKVTEWRLHFRRIMNESENQASTKSVDSLLNYETVKYFDNEDHEARRFDVALRNYQDAAVTSQYTLSALNTGQSAIISVGLSLTLIMAAQGVAGGSLSVGDFVLVNSYLIQLAMPLFMLGMFYREVRQSLLDMEYMFSLLRVEPEIRDKPGALPLSIERPTVRFENVGFHYDPARPILRNIDFEVPPGGKVALVGPSGAGKSTIARLLFRFYDATEGTVRIGDHDIREVQQASLRKSIGVVPQDTVLFNDTIGYNIAYGRPDANDEDIAAAARAAAIYDFIMRLPDKFDTMVGERGLKLSGGEKQRVAIARTVLKNPPILIFDEATSALDTATEQAINEQLSAISRERTTLIIAHRLSTVVDADQILVLVDGEIVERGDHQSLLSKNGVYAGMWKRQQESMKLSEALAQNQRLDNEPPVLVRPELGYGNRAGAE